MFRTKPKMWPNSKKSHTTPTCVGGDSCRCYGLSKQWVAGAACMLPSARPCRQSRDGSDRHHKCLRHGNLITWIVHGRGQPSGGCSQHCSWMLGTGCPLVTSWLIAKGIYAKKLGGLQFAIENPAEPPRRCCRNWSSSVFQGLGLDPTTSLMPSRTKQHYRILKHKHTSSLGPKGLKRQST